MNKKILKILLFIVIITTAISYVDGAVVEAAAGTTSGKYKLLETVSGDLKEGKEAKFPQYITGIYKFALGIVSISALLMIVIGGFYYIASAGNQAQASTAKKIITDAILGLIVVFIAVLVLNVINPDLLNSSPSMGALQSVADYTKANAGKTVQKDTWCSNGVCFDSYAKCTAGGAVDCKKSADSFEDKGVYTINDNGKYVPYNGTYAECLNANAGACQTGQNISNDLKYGAKEATVRAQLEEGDKIKIAHNAKTEHLTEKGINDLKKTGEVTGERLYIEGVDADGKTVHTNIVNSNMQEYIRTHDNIEENDKRLKDYSWGKAENGDLYYKIDDANNDLDGYVFVYTGGRDDKIILPKEDGGEYTLKELGIKSNDSDSYDDSDDDPDKDY